MKTQKLEKIVPVQSQQAQPAARVLTAQEVGWVAGGLYRRSAPALGGERLIYLNGVRVG